MKADINFYSSLSQFFLELIMFQTKFTEEINTHFAFGNFFFFLKNRPFFEILWETLYSL